MTKQHFIANAWTPASQGGAIPAIANTAHAVGLITGAAIAYAPLLVRKPA